MMRGLHFGSLDPFLAATTLVAFAAGSWYMLVGKHVPEPYLDEVFHIRQADNYVHHRWYVWDPKITTPPGLYFLPSLPFLLVNDNQPVDTGYFRVWNYTAILLLVFLVMDILKRKSNTRNGGTGLKDVAWFAKTELVHHTVNICLFPPLFFFYALFYTDVWSGVSVLLAYRCYLARSGPGAVVVVGLLSLLFRQTNIFWVSIFVGGLTFCDTICIGEDGSKFPHKPTIRDIIKPKKLHASAYDPLISEAFLEDYIKSVISYVVAAAADLPSVAWPLTPYLTILSAFGALVALNGSVVLGDKENHVASIHLAQMLYIWPYFAFFSAPLLYTYFLDVLASAFSPPLTLRSQNDKTAATRKRLPRLVIDIPAILLMLAIVHYNTIVHPFTLADNRHYMFYIFRLLLRHPAMKYIATPVYYICAVATIDALGDRERQGFQYSHPKGPSRGESKRNDKASAVSNTSSSPQGNRVSFLLIWLLATALSLCTAPLVEPRYCIVPWLTWRINVASPRRGDQGYDPRLWLETMWLLLVNAVTGYVFLFWGFAWPQEPGKIQRFMW